MPNNLNIKQQHKEDNLYCGKMFHMFNHVKHNLITCCYNIIWCVGDYFFHKKLFWEAKQKVTDSNNLFKTQLKSSSLLTYNKKLFRKSDSLTQYQNFYEVCK